MEKKPFIGRFTGFLYIGEEKAEFDGGTLVSYYAKPYCSDKNTVPENCIEFSNDKLTLRDVHSPDGERYDCIWEQEDIESLLDKLGSVSAYQINKICCGTIKQLVIPSVCMGIADDAFDDCPKLKRYFVSAMNTHRCTTAPSRWLMHMAICIVTMRTLSFLFRPISRISVSTESTSLIPSSRSVAMFPAAVGK